MTTVRINALYSLAGNAVYAICQLGMLIALARLATPAEVGIFSLALVITAPVLLLASLQLRQLLASDAAGEFAFNHYLTLRLATTVLACIGLVIFVLMRHADEGEALVIIAMTAAKCIESLAEIVYGLFQRHERLGLIAGSLAAKGIGGLATLTLTLALVHDLAAAVWAMAAWWGCVLLVVDLPAARRLVGWSVLRPVWAPTLVARLIRHSAPLGIVAALLSVAASAPSYLLDHWHGNAALGGFSPIVYLLAAGNLMVLSAGNAALPRLAHYHATGNRHGFAWLAFKLTGLSLGVSLAALLVSILAGGAILSLVYGASYAEGGSVLAGLAIAAGLNWTASAWGYVLTAARRLTVQLPLSAAAALAGIAAGSFLIPAHGVAGAVWTSTIVGGVLAAGYSCIALLAIGRTAPPQPGSAS